MRFLEIIGGWINRHFSHEEAIYLVVLLVGIFLVLVSLGWVLAPVLTGLVLAFLLEGLVARLVKVRVGNWHVPEWLAVQLTFVLFIGGLVALMLFVFPLAWRQLVAFVNTLPNLIGSLQSVARDLPERFPNVVSEAQVESWLAMFGTEVTGMGRALIEGTLMQVPSVLGLTIYLVLVPISVFFFLKDRQLLMDWVRSLLPEERPLIDRVGGEMNRQIANYVRGKFVEILIIGVATYAIFAIMGLNYAALLGLIVGLSVLVPFIGAAVVTVPVALVAFLQWGWSWDFAWVMVAYGIIQALDGNVLVPLLFSEAVDLHPITIIVAVLAFGGLWGFWGVFFAIPLATLVKAIYTAWPSTVVSPAIERSAETDSGASLP